MKKNLLWLAGTAVLVACAQTELEPVETKAPVKHEIKVDAYMQGHTRAFTETTAGSLESGFNLCIVNNGTESTTTNYTMQKGASSWEYYVSGSKVDSPTWPNDGSTLDFYAWNSPASFAPSFADNVISISVPEGFDFVVASATGKYYKAPGSVELSFIHTLAQVSINVKPDTDGNKYYLKSVNIKNDRIAQYAISDNSWTLDTSADAPALATIAYDDFTTASFTYTPPTGGSATIDAVEVTSAGLDTGTSLIIPYAENDGKVTLEVEYVVVDSSDSFIADFTGASARVYELADQLTPNQNVQVNVTLTATMPSIAMAVSVGKWNSPTNLNY